MEIFDAKTIVENYEDLANEIEDLTGTRDNHFETIMGFIEEYKKLKAAQCVHSSYSYFVTQYFRRCIHCGEREPE